MSLAGNGRGIALMCLSMAMFTINDTAMKMLMESLPMMQAIALRGLLSTVALAVLAWRRRALWPVLARRDLRLVGWRTAAELAATLTFLAALAHMPIASLSAILQILPLAMTLAAAVFLGEKVGWRRLTAIATGFAGVLLVIRPGTGGFNLWALLGLASVLAVVVRDMSTRGMGANVPSAFVALVTAAAVAAMGAAGTAITGEWAPVGPRELVLLCVTAAALILGLLSVVAAMRTGDVGVVSPFRYTALLWALLAGWLIFGDLPDGPALLGAALIVGSGVFTLVRERHLARRAARSARGAPIGGDR